MSKGWVVEKMKDIVYKCLNEKCDTIFHGINKDGICCPVCENPVVPIMEFKYYCSNDVPTYNDLKQSIRTVHISPYRGTEEEIMNHLIDAFNLFAKLGQTHPSSLSDFVNGIHKCQDAIICRIVQRDYPEQFPIKCLKDGAKHEIS